MTIEEIKNDLIKYFIEEDCGISIIFPLKVRLGYSGLEPSRDGIKEINEKYGDKHSYVISSNEDETEMVMFVFRQSLVGIGDTIAMYCIKKDKIFEFNAQNGKSMLDIERFKGDEGSAMILSSIKFRNSMISPDLILTTESVGVDIITWKRSFK